MVKNVFARVENIVGKAKNADNQHFLLFSQHFQKASSSEVIQTWDCEAKG